MNLENLKQWELEVTEYMLSKGWMLDQNDDTTLSFSFIKGDAHWIRDYDKKNQRFVQYNGNQIVNLRATSEKSIET